MSKITLLKNLKIFKFMLYKLQNFKFKNFLVELQLQFYKSSQSNYIYGIFQLLGQIFESSQKHFINQFQNIKADILLIMRRNNEYAKQNIDINKQDIFYESQQQNPQNSNRNQKQKNHANIDRLQQEINYQKMNSQIQYSIICPSSISQKKSLIKLQKNIQKKMQRKHWSDQAKNQIIKILKQFAQQNRQKHTQNKRTFKSTQKKTTRYTKLICPKCSRSYNANSMHSLCQPKLKYCIQLEKGYWRCKICFLQKRRNQLIDHDCKKSLTLYKAVQDQLTNDTFDEQLKSKIMNVIAQQNIQNDNLSDFFARANQFQKKNPQIRNQIQYGVSEKSVQQVRFQKRQQNLLDGQQNEYIRQIQQYHQKIADIDDLQIQMPKNIRDTCIQYGQHNGFYESGGRRFVYQYRNPFTNQYMQDSQDQFQQVNNDRQYRKFKQTIGNKAAIEIDLNLKKQKLKATIQQKVKLIAISALVKFMGSLQMRGQQKIIVFCQNNRQYFDYASFRQRTIKKFPIVKSFRKTFRQALIPYVQFNQNQYARLKNFDVLINNLIDFTQGINWEQYSKRVAKNLTKNKYFYQQRQIKKRGPYKNPLLKEQRQKQSKRKYARKKRNQTRKGRITRLCRQRYIQQNICRKNRQRIQKYFKIDKVLQKQVPKSQIGRNKLWKQIKNQLINSATYKCADYLICAQFLYVLSRADTNSQSQKIKMFRRNQNSSRDHTKFIKEFIPYIPKLNEFQQVSQSTIQAQKNNIIQIFNQEVQTKNHQLKQFNYQMSQMKELQIKTIIIKYLSDNQMLKKQDSFPNRNRKQLAQLNLNIQNFQLPEGVPDDALQKNAIVQIPQTSILCVSCQKWILYPSRVITCQKCGVQYHQNNICPPTHACKWCKQQNQKKQIQNQGLFPNQLFTEQVQMPKGVNRVFKHIKTNSNNIIQTITWDLVRQMIQGQIYKCQYVTQNTYYQDFVFYPSFNEQFKLLPKQDQQYIQTFRVIPKQGKFNLTPLPLAVYDQGNGKGNCVYASRDIQRGQFLGFYAGDIVSLSQIQKNKKLGLYALDMIKGPNALKSFCIAPKTHMGVGPLFNCGQEDNSNVNIQIIKVFSYKYGPQAFFRAKKNIKLGKQLCWQYNSQFKCYDTNFNNKFNKIMS